MLSKNRDFYKTFLRLCLALMLEQAVVLSVNLADNMMLGTYSEAALSGVAAVNQIQFVFQQVVYAIANSMIVLGSQYWGQRRLGEIKKISAIGIRLEIFVAVLLFALVSIFPVGALKIFTSNSSYISEGVSYLKIIRFSYIFFALNAVLLSTMRIVESVKIALRVSFLSLIINVSINYLLIGGAYFFPEMGAQGAAIGTLTARVVEFIIVLSYVLRDKKLGMRIRDAFVKTGLLVKDFIAVAIPTLGSALLWSFANVMQTVILGHMNDSAIAAQSISNTVFLLLKVTSVGAAAAASVIIGKTVGEGDIKRVKEYARTLQVVFIFIGAMLCGMMLIIRIPLLRIYEAKISAATYDLASTYILIQSVVLFTMSYQMPVNTGIIRGGGDTKFVMYLDIAAVCIFVPLASLGGLVWKWSPVVIIILVNLDQMLKCIPAFIRANGYKWVRKLTR